MSPCARGNETPTACLRQYFPTSTDLSRWAADDIATIARTLNTRPRKTTRHVGAGVATTD